MVKSECQQADGSYTFCCKILSHVKKEPNSFTNSPSIAVKCCDGLSAHLEGLFDEMKFSDVIFNIGGREFPAHKSILAARSEVFAAMFQHPTKEKLTNQITIEDVDAEMFKELLRFIYTGRLNETTMDMMAASLFIAADKYLLDELKGECESYLLCQMSPNNCVVLLSHVNLDNPAEHLKELLKEAAKYLRRHPTEVMATDGWKELKEENSALICDILKFVRVKNMMT